MTGSKNGKKDDDDWLSMAFKGSESEKKRKRPLVATYFVSLSTIISNETAEIGCHLV